MAFKEGLAIEGWQKLARHFQLFVEFRQQVRRDMFGQFWVVHAGNLDRFSNLVPIGAVHDL